MNLAISLNTAKGQHRGIVHLNISRLIRVVLPIWQVCLKLYGFGRFEHDRDRVLLPRTSSLPDIVSQKETRFF
jgi:hypothetical protein